MRSVLVSAEMIVPEDTGAAVTLSESAQVYIYIYIDNCRRPTNGKQQLKH